MDGVNISQYLFFNESLIMNGIRRQSHKSVARFTEGTGTIHKRYISKEIENCKEAVDNFDKNKKQGIVRCCSGVTP